MPAAPVDRWLARLGDLRTRTLWGAGIGLAAAIPLLYGGLPAALLAAAAGGAMAWEWRRITLGPRFEPILGWLLAAAAGAAALLAHSGAMGLTLLYLLGAAAVIGLLDRMERRDWRWGPLGLLTVGLAAACFAALRGLEPFGLETALWIVGVVVACDVGAYFAGRLVGGPKLWPRVSPSKTWAGLGGGVLLAALVGGVFSWATTGTYFQQVCTVSAVAAIVAQGGDLAESTLKRRFGVKDSGTLIPGHGGALDRLDGFCAATMVAAAVTFLRGGQPVFIW